MDTVVRRGADVGSDHYLVETRLKLKLKRSPMEKEGRTRFGMQKLADEEIRNKYNIEVRNRFQVLEGLVEEEEENADQTNNRMENVYVATAKEVLATAKRGSKPWLCGRTWKKLEERRQVKMKLESTRSERVKQRIREQNKGKDREVKRSAREDKRRWMSEMAGDAERAAENGRTGELHRKVKTLTGEKRRVSTAVNDKNGRPTNEGSERLNIWKEHFDAVLNKGPPERPIQPHEMERRQNDREFDIGPFRPTEVKSAIKATKNRKVAGLDNVVAELLKTDLDERTKKLTKLFNTM